MLPGNRRRGVRGSASLLLKASVLVVGAWCCQQLVFVAHEVFVSPSSSTPGTTVAAQSESSPAALMGRRSLAVLEKDTVAVEQRERENTKRSPEATSAAWEPREAEEVEDEGSPHEDEGPPEKREERIRALGLALLQSAGKAEELFEKGETSVSEDGTLHLNEFRQLLKKLGLNSSSSDARILFHKFSPGGSSGISTEGFRECVRNGPVITEMYTESLSNVVQTVLLSLAVCAAIIFFKGTSSGLDFLTAYVVEDSLSVDNLFVFLALFKYFKVPHTLQNYCLNLGIYGAVILRGMFIFVGLAAVKSFQPLLLAFAGVLMYASYQGLTGDEDGEDDEEEEPAGPIKELLGMLPTTSEFHGDRLVVQSASKPGEWLATPLALCIIAVELSDILFAVDSIPAVFAVTDDPIIVYTSNIAAILGLRSLYQVLSVAAQDLAYLEKSVAIVLGFVGIKLAAEVIGYEVSSVMSLVVILGVLGAGIALSLQEQRKSKDDASSGSAVA
mmetsp:Transcript_24041/g.59983  ORF Transcript_24041/g.59983 Transcript_24041/m.59983 type:complete len:501 (+) Transcript_24041:73-1575(+)